MGVLKSSLKLATSVLLLFAARSPAERINQEGRILGPLPVATNSILFNTTNADVVVSAMQIFPVTNPWNEDVSHRPVLVNSDAMIVQINSDVGSSHRKLLLFQEMNFVLVPDNQPLVKFSFLGGYPDESDLNGGTFPVGSYPIPTNMPVEGWPANGVTLTQSQSVDDGNDRHSIIVQPGAGFIYESWRALRVSTNWGATNGAIFNLNTNALRVINGNTNLTSGDAAGFPMFPALVRYDECQRGMVEHACRLVIVHSRSQHIFPAAHDAGSVSAGQTNYPAMGQRLRLKASYGISNSWSTAEKALLLGLKKYGAMVSDNSSSFFSISITPDDRWGNAFNNISTFGLAITNFEVVQTTGPTEGPRSPGAPVAGAGVDQSIAFGQPAQLQGAVNFSGAQPAIQWRQYSGSGIANFGNAALTNTTVTFSAPGVYTLMLAADDGVHAVAYDAVLVAVSQTISLGFTRSDTNLNLSWIGGTSPFVVERTGTLPASLWSGVVTTGNQNASVPITSSNGFFRVRGQ